MASASRSSSSCGFLLLLVSLMVMILIFAVRSEIFNVRRVDVSIIKSDAQNHWNLQDCKDCVDRQSVDITATYMDSSGNFKTHKVKSTDLSSSWSWENSVDDGHARPKGQGGSYQRRVKKLQENNQPSINQHHLYRFICPVKLERQRLRQQRKEQRVSELIHMSKETELQMEAAAIEGTKKFNLRSFGKYSIGKKEYLPTPSDSTSTTTQISGCYSLHRRLLAVDRSRVC